MKSKKNSLLIFALYLLSSAGAKPGEKRNVRNERIGTSKNNKLFGVPDKGHRYCFDSGLLKYCKGSNSTRIREDNWDAKTKSVLAWIYYAKKRKLSKIKVKG